MDHALQSIYGYDDYPIAGNGKLGGDVLTNVRGVPAGTGWHDRDRRMRMEVAADQIRVIAGRMGRQDGRGRDRGV